MYKVYIFLTLFISFSSFSAQQAILDSLTEKEPLGKFSGRVSTFNANAKLVRFHMTFDNIKYINKLDKLQFWSQHQERQKCEGIVLGRSSSYVLVKIPDFYQCNLRMAFTVGRYYEFYSKDLANNITMGNELVDILLKKRLALKGKMSRNDKIVDTYLQRVETVNKRYEILRSKLEAEWRGELSKMEGDYQDLKRNQEGLQIRLNEVNHKLERYRVEDSNLTEDRWALDEKNYYLK